MTARDAATGELVDGLVQLSEAVQSAFARTAAGHDLPALQARLLGVLRGRRPAMAQLALLLDLDRPSATGLVDRAQRRGLVRRIPAPDDGRSSLVELTEEGRDLAARFVTDVDTVLAALADELPERDRAVLSGLLHALVRRHARTAGVDLAAGLDDGRER